MFLFVNGKTRVMLLPFRMHTHHNLLPLLITLEKKKKKRNIVRDYNDSVSRIDQTTIEVLQTSRDAHP